MKCLLACLLACCSLNLREEGCSNRNGIYHPCPGPLSTPPPPLGVQRTPRAGRIAPCVGPKAPNMQESHPLSLYATLFTRVPLPFTRGSKELRLVVCSHYLPHVDTVCSTGSTTVDTAGML